MEESLYFKSMSIASAEHAMSTYTQIVVHPCVINDQPHIIYPRGLKEKSPGLFERLSQHFLSKGYNLKEDQRSDNTSNKFNSERRKWAPVLLFTASLFFESSAFADVEVEINEAKNIPQQQQVELQLISNQHIRQQIQGTLSTVVDNSQQVKIKSQLAGAIFEILNTRYQRKPSDPEYIEEDLKQVANYYSDFPESIALIEDLKDENWELVFDEHNWVTTGSGSMMQVNKAVIHFNTRSAAQLKLNNGCADNPVCIASPADALLHELLHTHSMLVKSEEFIAQGGMNNVMYPYKHEYAVIDKERELYARMSSKDNIKRPQRREHTGRTVKARCPTCIK